MNREAAEEKEKFLNAIRTFNSDFNLLNKRDLVFESQIRSEMQTLQSEAEALTKGRLMHFLMELTTQLLLIAPVLASRIYAGSSRIIDVTSELVLNCLLRLPVLHRLT